MARTTLSSSKLLLTAYALAAGVLLAVARPAAAAKLDEAGRRRLDEDAPTEPPADPSWWDGDAAGQPDDGAECWGSNNEMPADPETGLIHEPLWIYVDVEQEVTINTCGSSFDVYPHVSLSGGDGFHTREDNDSCGAEHSVAHNNPDFADDATGAAEMMDLPGFSSNQEYMVLTLEAGLHAVIIQGYSATGYLLDRTDGWPGVDTAVAHFFDVRVTCDSCVLTCPVCEQRPNGRCIHVDTVYPCQGHWGDWGACTADSGDCGMGTKSSSYVISNNGGAQHPLHPDGTRAGSCSFANDATRDIECVVPAACASMGLNLDFPSVTETTCGAGNDGAGTACALNGGGTACAVASGTCNFQLGEDTVLAAAQIDGKAHLEALLSDSATVTVTGIRDSSAAASRRRMQEEKSALQHVTRPKDRRQFQEQHKAERRRRMQTAGTGNVIMDYTTIYPANSAEAADPQAAVAATLSAITATSTAAPMAMTLSTGLAAPISTTVQTATVTQIDGTVAYSAVCPAEVTCMASSAIAGTGGQTDFCFRYMSAQKGTSRCQTVKLVLKSCKVESAVWSGC